MTDAASGKKCNGKRSAVERRERIDHLSGEARMIEIDLDVMLAVRKMTSAELAEKIDITPANLSILKTGKAKAIRFSTLEAICKTLNCQPGDIIKYVEKE